MMRAIVLLTGFFLAAADTSMEVQGECVVDSGEAISELMDASIYIWASTKRCGKSGEAVKCEVDITSAIESVTQMIKIIMKTVQKCSSLENGDCAIASTSLTSSLAGIAESSGGIISKCPNKMHPASNAAANWAHHNGALCIVDLKDTFKSLFKAIKEIMKVKKSCSDANSRACDSNGLHIMAALAGLGENLAGSVGHCSHTATLANCGSEISKLIHHLTKVAATGTDMARACTPTDWSNAGTDPDPNWVNTGRLYEQQTETARTTLPSNLLLGAFLPVTAIVSFVGGRFYANRRSRMEEGREVMSDHE